MIVETARPTIEVASSIGNLFDKSTFYTAFWPMEKVVDTIITQARYRGIEWHPMRISAGAQMNAGLISQDTKDAIVSLHQSYRSEKSLKEAWRHPNRQLAMVSFVMLPERVKSLGNLERLQKILGKELPIVLYPSTPAEESGTDRHFAEKLFQPTPEVMRDWNVKTPEELIIEARKRGYTGFCVDLFHVRGEEIDRFTLNPWQESLPQLLSFAKEIHVSAGRGDIKQNRIDTDQELRDLLKGSGDSELLSMLKEIRGLRWKGAVVTEIPAASLRALRSNQKLPVKDLIQDHQKIVGNIQDILA